MLFDALAKRLLNSKDAMAGLLAAAHPDLPTLVDTGSLDPIKELPTFHLRALVPDLIFEFQFTDPSTWPTPAPADVDPVTKAALIVEATSSPGLRTVHQVSLYVSQYQLAQAERGRGWTPVIAIVFTLGSRRSKQVSRAASWPTRANPPWQRVYHPVFFLVESRDKEAVARAARRSVPLAFAMELSVAATKGLTAVKPVMAEWGRALMEERIRYREHQDHDALMGVETVLQFLVSLAAEEAEEARQWVAEVSRWWKELGRAFGLSEEEVMAEMKPAFEWLIQDKLEEATRKAQERGWQKGLQQGLQQGIQRLRASVYDVLEERFGRVPEGVRTYVESITDLDRLGDVLRRALRVDRPEDLLNGH